MNCSSCKYQVNVAQRGDAIELLQSLPDACTPLTIFDPQHRSVLNKLAYGNEGARQKERARLPAMTDSYIDDCCREAARVLMPSGYLMLWSDAFRLCEGYHRRLKNVLRCVDMLSWDDERIPGGNGYRSRRCGGYLIVLQKPPIRARATWRDHGIRDHWSEKVDHNLHPHIKPIGLIARLIGAVTKPDALIVDPCAGSFAVMHAARQLGRNFIGCDSAYTQDTTAAFDSVADTWASVREAYAVIRDRMRQGGPGWTPTNARDANHSITIGPNEWVTVHPNGRLEHHVRRHGGDTRDQWIDRDHVATYWPQVLAELDAVIAELQPEED
jgi:site-specific DNA-methyltransferase (adenine-specific)